MGVYDMYRQKLRTAAEAVKVVKSGDWVDYTTFLNFPYLLDKALAKRRDELQDVKVRGLLIFGPLAVVECDPTREHFTYSTWHCSSYERKLVDRGLCNYTPMVFRNMADYYRRFLKVNVALLSVTPMDSHGYFNLSVDAGSTMAPLAKADVVIVEINEHLPRMFGGEGESIHISDVDFIVEGEHPPLMDVPQIPVSEADTAIAKQLVPQIPSGATLQLGIGGMPNTIGKMLAESDIKDLGMHAEFCSDAYVELYEAGKLTNRKKMLHPNKGVIGMAFGTPKLYNWLAENPGAVVYPMDYVNAPETIAKMDNMISINSCISVDLFGQVCAETAGLRHISGTGGQLDYLTGAFMANGGKAFICMSSSFVDKKGQRHSRIKPTFNGDIVTDPRSQAYYIVTEYGVVNLAGRNTWERAEMLVSLAHPDFREALIADAEKMHIWRRSNKR